VIRRAHTSTTSRGAGAGAAAVHASAACVPAGRPRSWLRVPLAHPQTLRLQTSGLPAALRVNYRMPSRSRVIVRVLKVDTRRPFGTVTLVWGRGRGGRLIPLDFSGVLGAVEFQLPAGACVARVTLGRLRFAG